MRLLTEAVGISRSWRLEDRAEYAGRLSRPQRLYEWFGFERIEPSGFVLGRPISVATA